MSNLPTFKYPFVIECQMFKKGRWAASTSIRKDMDISYAISQLEQMREILPEHNWRLLSLSIIDEW